MKDEANILYGDRIYSSIRTCTYVLFSASRRTSITTLESLFQHRCKYHINTSIQDESLFQHRCKYHINTSIQDESLFQHRCKYHIKNTFWHAISTYPT